MECPKKTGSKYYNYKFFFSLVLLTVCDLKYCFTSVDIRQYRGDDDTGDFKVSEMGQCFENYLIIVPKSSEVHGMSKKIS